MKLTKQTIRRALASAREEYRLKPSPECLAEIQRLQTLLHIASPRVGRAK